MPEFIRKGLGERLVQEGLITPEQYEQAMKKHIETKVILRKILVEMGFITEERLSQFMSKLLEIPYEKNLINRISDTDILKIIPEKYCRQYMAIPLKKEGGSLTVAMADPFDVFAIDDLEAMTKCKIKPVLSTKEEILKAIGIYYEDKGQLEEIVKGMAKEVEELEVIRESKEEEQVMEEEEVIVDTPIIRLVNTIITQGIKDRASDIHVEPDDDSLRIRYRVDGVLRESMSPPKKLQAPIISRIKIMAGMDISIKRSPQDGRFRLRVESKDIDVRISTVPTIYGEKVVMRLLDQSGFKMGLEQTGLNVQMLGQYMELIERPYGIILVTGPTGSGKTTTLYLALQSINSPDKNIITIEEPVEYDLEGINQIAVNIKAGVTFAQGLKSILRQDPDVIMVGEMRDLETAEVAIRAALTGHLVFSTLHTNDAPSSIMRIIDMGVPPYLVTSAVCCVLAQRLVRVICPECKEPYVPSQELLNDLGIMGPAKENTFYQGKGCEFCGETGYVGRTGIFELMVMDKELRNLIHTGCSADDIRACAQKNGMKSLWEDGIEKVKKGITTLKELKRVTFQEGEIPKGEVPKG